METSGAAVPLLASSAAPAQEEAPIENRDGVPPKQDLGVLRWLEENPEFDGRGVRVCVVDTGVDRRPPTSDLLHPALQATSTGRPKVVGYFNAKDGTEVDTGTVTHLEADSSLRASPADPRPSRARAGGRDLATRAHPVGGLPPRALEERLRVQRKRRAEAAGKETDGADPIFEVVVFRSGGEWTVVVDTDEDGQFGHERPVRDFSRRAVRGRPGPRLARTGDNHGSWRAHRHPAFRWLTGEVERHTRAFCGRLGFDLARIGRQFQRSWAVVSEPGQGVYRHHHPTAHVSCVYYLNGDGTGDTGMLRLFAPHRANELIPGMAVGFQGPIDPENPFNRGWVDIAPRAGLLVIFPSHTDHAVTGNEGGDLRLSISFDVYVSSSHRPGESPPEYMAPEPRYWDAFGKKTR